MLEKANALNSWSSSSTPDAPLRRRETCGFFLQSGFTGHANNTIGTHIYLLEHLVKRRDGPPDKVLVAGRVHAWRVDENLRRAHPGIDAVALKHLALRCLDDLCFICFLFLVFSF